MRASFISVLAIIAVLLTSCAHQQPANHLDMGTTIIDVSSIDIPKVVPSIQWQEISPDVIERSKRENTPIFAYLYLPECEMCDIVEQVTLKDERVVDRINSNYIPIKFNISEYLFLVCELRLNYAPAIAIIPEPGRPDVVIQGIILPERLLEVLDIQEERKIRPNPKKSLRVAIQAANTSVLCHGQEATVSGALHQSGSLQ